MPADILLPGLEITADPRVDRRLVIGLDGAGQNESLLGIAAHELCERDGGNRLRVRPLHEVLFVASPADEAIGSDAPCSNQRNDADQQELAWAQGLRRLRGHRASRQAWVARACTGAGSAVFRSRAWTTLNIVGTRNSVAQVANSRPPITARPSGAFWLGSIAIGTMPMIIASAVISTGRNRVLPASIAAVTASAPAVRRSRAKLITRMLLAVAMPMHMIAPVSAGTERVVPLANNTQTMPANAVGSAMTITNGSTQD